MCTMLWPTTPEMDERLTIDPPPFCCICRTAAAVPRKTPVLFTAITRSQRPESSRSFVALPLMPALFTRMSSRPNARIVAPTTLFQPASSVTFSAMNTALPPAALILSATALPSSSSMSAMTTLAPSLPKRLAVAAPMPEAAPVMIATLSARRMAVSSCLWMLNGSLPPPPPLGYRAVSGHDGDVAYSTGARSMARRGLTFGIFLAPFHRLGENPTLAIDRDVELIQWLDHLGYDEAWIGEHHSAGWELIASPELIIAAAAEKTKHIKLGSGVTSLPYHHPFLVAQRWVQLDHMTRGRAMLGCGPGALTSDAYMLGIEPSTQRPRMLQSMDAIMRLLKMEERVTIKTDWFEMNDAKLHLAPYSDPHFEIAVASTITPFGMIAAGTHGTGVLSIGAGLPGGPEALASQWKIAEDAAAKSGKTVTRKKWRVVVNAHIAEDDEQALA